jgi:lysyl-tRNA synthetase class 2
MTSNNMKDLKVRQDRIKKLQTIIDKGIIPFADKYEKTHQLADIAAMKDGDKVKVAGRLMLIREMGKLTFAHLQDASGRGQIVLRQDDIGKDSYKDFLQLLNVGDFIGVEGEVFTTKKGEISILAANYKLLSKSLRPLPEKWHGLKDQEACYRQRYLDLTMNRETMERMNFRSKFIWELRNFYHENGFTELETPILCNAASGALAKPFTTHHSALDMDVYLRIAPEIYLKEAIVAGFEKVFEAGRVFRNEGIDPSHLQEFTMVEHYAAYWDYKMNMEFTEKMLTTIIKKLKGTLKLPIIDRAGETLEVDFALPWKVASFRELLLEDCDIDIDKFIDAQSLRKEIKKKKINIENAEKLGRGNLIDALYKEVSRPKLVNPTFLINHPTDLSPLARKNDKNPMIVDRFQLVVNGWEIVNAYSELIDPVDQAQRFEQQTAAKAAGDEEAMSKDDEFVSALEYGMPPTSGWGMGIERIVTLLTGQTNLKDVILFPLMKPTTEDENN